MQLESFIEKITSRWEFISRNKLNEIIKLALTSFIILFIYFIFRISISKLTGLSYDAYYENSILLAFLKKTIRNLFFIIPFVISLIYFRKKLLVTWSSFEKGIFIRNFMLLMCAILAWMFAFYEYNFFFDQSHLMDRIVLLVLMPLIFWRPIFIIPFITQVLLIIGQSEALFGFTRTFPLYPIHIIILFISFYIFRLLGGKFKFVYFIYLLGCVLATQYAFSGAGKVIKSGWITHNQISFVLTNSYANGWLGALDEDTITKIAKGLSLFNTPLKIFTIAAELSVLFFFWKRSWTKILLFALLVLHVGIYMFSGIFFWAWIFIDLLFIFLILKKGLFDEQLIFNPKAFVLSGFIIVSGYFWSQPAKLVWLDVPLNYTHQLYGETENGKTVYLSPDFFKPFDYQFKLSHLNYLDKKMRAPIVAGVATNKSVFEFLKVNRSDTEIFEFEKTQGTIFFDETYEKELVHFLQKFISNRNNTNASRKKYLSYLAPPDYLWSRTPFVKNPEETLEDGDKIKKIHVITKTTYYDTEKGYREIRKDTIKEISIPLNY